MTCNNYCIYILDLWHCIETNFIKNETSIILKLKCDTVLCRNPYKCVIIIYFTYFCTSVLTWKLEGFFLCNSHSCWFQSKAEEDLSCTNNSFIGCFLNWFIVHIHSKGFSLEGILLFVCCDLQVNCNFELHLIQTLHLTYWNAIVIFVWYYVELQLIESLEIFK